MLHAVDLVSQPPHVFEPLVGHETVERLRELARPLRGLRLLELNATSYGGGVSELLRSQAPALRGLGLEVDWAVVQAEPSFFAVTKSLHNALQGAAQPLGPHELALYTRTNAQIAASLPSDYDVIIVHDPQAAPLRALAAERARHWIWRCHIDTSQPDPAAWQFLYPYVACYDAAIFTMSAFVPPQLDPDKVAIIAPAIDPLSPKNLPLPRDLARRLIEWTGLRLDRPLMTQVSRFDPWKDPLGVIDVYRRARERVPDLQLALLGSMALDDPQGWEMYRTILAACKHDPAIHVFTNLTGIGSVEVNAFQALSDIVVQKSIREGFGLVVSETLWKGTPIVAGRAGGIPLQIPPEAAALLVDDSQACAAEVVRLLEDPHEAMTLGARGRDWVRQRFLLPRLLADELRLLQRVIDAQPLTPEGAEARTGAASAGRMEKQEECKRRGRS